jgi:hypothetical protein
MIIAACCSQVDMSQVAKLDKDPDALPELGTELHMFSRNNPSNNQHEMDIDKEEPQYASLAETCRNRQTIDWTKWLLCFSSCRKCC